MGHIGGKGLLLHQCVQQAGFAHTHPAKHRHAQAPLLQRQQLLIKPLEVWAQSAALAVAQPQPTAPLAQQQLTALSGGGGTQRRRW